MTHLDGNALAGPLADLFATDMTMASGHCAGCGLVAELARAAAFVTAMGAVLRCGGCDAVLAVFVELPGRRLLSLAGLRTVEMPTA